MNTLFSRRFLRRTPELGRSLELLAASCGEGHRRAAEGRLRFLERELSATFPR